MKKDRIRILSNLKGLGRAAAGEEGLTHEHLGDGAGAPAFLRACLRSDVVVLNIDQKRLMLAGLLKLLWPAARFRLVSVDLILRPPKTWKDRAKVFVKRVLFSRVDRFILYFKDLRGYERFYGIKSDRAAYVPFKVNGWDRIQQMPPGTPEGDYALCAGRTLRDVRTFVEAVGHAGCPGVRLQQRRELLAEHGTAEWEGELPANVKLVVDDGDTIESYLGFIARARLVVVPRFVGDIAPTGISTYLVAMALNKCVVISAGPGAGDVLDGQAVVVPPEDAAALGEQIKSLWDDGARRSEVAGSGLRYARTLAGEDRLMKDILRAGLGAAAPEGSH
jgi:glycosyltransferase involved in cell wall biosynthesis